MEAGSIYTGKQTHQLEENNEGEVIRVAICSRLLLLASIKEILQKKNDDPSSSCQIIERQLRVLLH